MPFKSQAQRRKFAELLVAGEISPRHMKSGTARPVGKAPRASETEDGAQRGEAQANDEAHRRRDEETLELRSAATMRSPHVVT